MSQGPAWLDPLNERELEVIGLLAEGLSNNEIANQLFLAPSTIKWYVRQLNSKLDTNNRNEIVALANELGLLEALLPAETYMRPRENLPRQTTTFIGRDAELDELHHILGKPDVRLLTILAPGGMGKTRIALEAAEQQINNFSDGVYFVPLQAIAEIQQIIPAIASSSFFTFQSDERSQKQQVLDFLANKQMLLLIDNLEHLLDAAPLINEIMTAAPKVKLLATSREKLNLLGETVYVLQGMEFPTWETPEDALKYDAVQLLVQAAQRVKPDWELTQDNLNYVARVCRLTQGMPLGILLAASWLDIYSLERICEEIQNSADILETQMRDVPERQRSIRAVFEYSWERLKPDEQEVLIKMSVFRGGCSPQAAEQITRANPRIFHSLVNKALFSKNREGRYDLHELLRQYAEERLQETNEAEKTRDAHMNYYAQALQEHEEHLKDYRQIEMLNDIEGDFENIRAAWLRAVEQLNEPVLAAILNSLWLFSSLRSHNEEVLTLFQAMMALEGRISQRLWGRLLARQGYLYENMGQLEQASELLEAAIKIARQYDKLDLPMILYRLSVVVLWQGQFENTYKLVEESLALFEKNNDLWGQAWAKSTFGVIHEIHLEAPEAAYRLNKEAYDFFKQQGTPDAIAQTTQNLGFHLIRHGDIGAAQDYLLESLACYRKIGGNWWWGHTNTLSVLVDIELYYGHFDKANEYATEAYQVAVDSANLVELHFALDIRCEILLTQMQFQETLDITYEMEASLDSILNLHSIWLPTSRGMALCGLERYQEASTWIDKALLQGFDSIQKGHFLWILFGKCITLAQQGQQERALEILAFIFVQPETRLWRDTHPLALRLKAQLQAHFDESIYKAIWARGATKVDNWRDVMKALVDEIGNEE